MKRNVLFVGILPLVALFVWSASKAPAVPMPAPVGARHSTPAPAETPGLRSPCEGCVPAAESGTMAHAKSEDNPFQAQSDTHNRPAHTLFISGITEHLRQIFLLGPSLGNRANVFSKIGDSITANAAFLAPIGWGRYGRPCTHSPTIP
jgi:hypothetical protein